MCVTGRPFCDFASYDPRLPEHLRLFIKRVPRDDQYIAEIEAEVRKFLSEMEEKISKLQEMTL